MKMLLRVAAASMVLATAGCALLPNNRFFTPPPASADAPWLRVVDNTEQTSIYQTLNGQRSGGLIRSSEWVLQNTQDRGMPKASGEDYNIDYYETPLVAGVETAVENVYVEGKHQCLISARFTPEQGKKYQFRLESDTLNFRCRVHAAEVVKDNHGMWSLKPLQNVRYSAKEGSGWHPMHTSL
ncbi:hypothetical protein [Winslowiella iniecta]|uniref:hypothetical protein n=1 Tax=Winslowiella iniecta TaxID=1560201 RepID=UPI000ACCE329|nr:hypothetical protein [Winslowiella iniecta]